MQLFTIHSHYVDPNIATREDRLTPLHFAARYIPRVVDKAVEQQESEASRRGTVVKVGKRSTSVRLIQYLVNLKTDRVKVCNYHYHDRPLTNNNNKIVLVAHLGAECKLVINENA